MKKRGEKGISGVITVVLLILLSIVAVVIVWQVVGGTIKSSAKKTSTIEQTFTNVKMDKSTVKINQTSGIVEIKMTRESGDAPLTKIKFVLSNGSDSYVYEANASSMQIFEEKLFVISFGPLVDVSEIKAYPIIMSSQGEPITASTSTDTYTVTGREASTNTSLSTCTNKCTFGPINATCINSNTSLQSTCITNVSSGCTIWNVSTVIPCTGGACNYSTGLCSTPAGNTISACKNITSPGSYTLTSDLTYSGNSKCLDIQADYVIINCNSKSITGGSSGYGVYSFIHSDIEVKNCNILNFMYGIYLSYGNKSSFTNNIISGSSSGGIHLTFPLNISIANNKISSSGFPITVNSFISSQVLIYNNIINGSSSINFSNSGSVFLNITKTPGLNIVGRNYTGGNAWLTPMGTGFSQNSTLCTDANSDNICDNSAGFGSPANYDYLPLKAW